MLERALVKGGFNVSQIVTDASERPAWSLLVSCWLETAQKISSKV
jgi:hypothetical protein